MYMCVECFGSFTQKYLVTQHLLSRNVDGMVYCYNAYTIVHHKGHIWILDLL